MTIRLGHSPDSDDAFMFWGLANGQVQSEYQFEHILRDIQTLNEWAMEGRLESSAVSVHAFAYVADKYALLRHGGSFGEQYGPMVVSSEPLAPADLKDLVIAVPGTLTSAFLELNLFYRDHFEIGAPTCKSIEMPKEDLEGVCTGGLRYAVVPFDEIIPSIQRGDFKAGLIIHEGQLTYAKEGLHLVADMGKWWNAKTGLPLPLGVNVVRKDLGKDAVVEVSRCMRESIDAGLKGRSQALDYALQFARGMDTQTSDTFVGMYVNDRTRDMGDEGVRAIKLLLEEGGKAGLIPAVGVEVVD
ncbi:MAG: ABC transporter substrate-binding protein [Armatimonadetes bacterium]|nr:ABC transporter substrate-binding protein [Armatimonadota bacterium]